MLRALRTWVGGLVGYAAPVALVAVAVFFLADTYGSADGVYPGDSVTVASFHSDDLYTVDLCRQALAGYDFRGCHLPYTPYVFPDMLLQLPGMALSSDVGIVYLSYSLFYYGLTVLGLAWIARQCGVHGREALWHAGAGVALLLATHLAGPLRWRGVLLAHPSNHAGIILVGLFLVGLAVSLVRRGPTLLTTAAFLLAGGLGAFSDRLLVVQFLAPLSLALFVLACLRQLALRRLLVAAAWIGGSVVLSEALRRVAAWAGFILLPVEDDFKLASVREMLHFLFRTFPASYAGQPVVVAVMVLGALAATAAAVTAGLRRRPEILLPALACLLAGACNVAAVLIVGLGNFASAFPRYTLPLVVLPFLFLSLFVGLLPRPVGRAGLGVVAAAAAGAVLQVGLRVPAFSWQHLRQPYPALVRAVDALARERGCRCGLGDFWSARATSLLSREGVHVKPLGGNGVPWVHSDNPNAFLPPGPEALAVPEYRFLVVARHPRPASIPPDTLLWLYGEPAERRVVDADWELWVYDELACPRLDRFLVGLLAQKYRATHRYVAPAWPRQLARPKANLSRWDSRRNVAIGPGHPVEVLFDHPVTGAALDFAADADSAYEILFYRGQEKLGTLRAPACWTGGVWNYDRHGRYTMFARLLSLPAELRERPWDRAVVRRLGGSDHSRLGHFLVYSEAPPLPDGTRGSRPRPYRFEGENLLMLPGSAVSNVDDPWASGGRYRRAGKGFTGPVAYGPYIALDPGRYRIDFAVRAEALPGPGPLGWVDVTATPNVHVLATRELSPEDVEAAGGFRQMSLFFDLDVEQDAVQFRVMSRGGTALALDYVDLVPLPASSGGPSAGAAAHQSSLGEEGTHAP